MATAPRTYTFEDFCALIPDGQKADLIDGEIYMASPDNTAANELNGWLYAIMLAFAQKKDLGKVFVGRVAYRLDRYNGPEPDIGFVPKRNVSRIHRGHVKGPPALAVEIVSPDSIERDYIRKRQQYEQFGVREYWIVDELKKNVTLLRLDDQGKFREVRPRKGILVSQVLTGFWISVAWLWQDPLPDMLDTLVQILG